MNHDRSNGQVRGQWIADAIGAATLMIVLTPPIYYLVRKWPNALATAALFAGIAIGASLSLIFWQINRAFP